MVGPEIDYVKVKDKSGKKYYLAEARLSANFKEEVEVLERMKGKDLAGKRYKPLFPFFLSERGVPRNLGRGGLDRRWNRDRSLRASFWRDGLLRC